MKNTYKNKRDASTQHTLDVYEYIKNHACAQTIINMRNLASSSNNDNYLEKSMVLLTKLRIESEKKIACDCDLSIGTIQAECKSSTSTKHTKDFDELVIGQLMGDYKLKNLLLKYNHSMAEEIHRVIP